MYDKRIRVAISIGDLNGIGPEIILKTFEDQRMFDFCTPVVFANYRLLSYYRKTLRSKTQIHPAKSLEQLAEDKLNVIDVWDESVTVKLGQQNKEIGGYAIKSLEAAIKSLKENQTDVLVTAPIHKENVQSDEFNFPGHTDYLSQQFEGESLMFMVSEGLKVGLLTDHVPLADVVNHLTPELITQKVETIHQSLIQDYAITRPKIAVLGINPHVGDNGVIGSEDDVLLRPTLDKIRESGKLVFGPYPADSFFGSDTYKSFDAVLASYHDQGLIPFKTLSFGQGVNFTAGLSHIRTSPDHGTAFDIAGKGKANHNSFRQAVYEAINLYRNRVLHLKLTSNPLKRQLK